MGIEKEKIYIVSETKMDELKCLIEQVLNHLQNKSEPISLGDWVTEAESRKMLSKGKSWFHYMRRKGYFTQTKLGNTVYINKEDILKYLEKNKKSAFRK